ncbi:MAG: hypothetical protein DCC49_00855 [Acidobacteria bacterium]|nr:MAG: hypothetical protein DCC49_00855 [Acidobacteriota bacterium]
MLLLIAVLVLAGACKRPGEWDTEDPLERRIVPSPFPQNYSWALMTLDGALMGEGSVQQPQRGIDSLSGRYTESGITIDFGHGGSSFTVNLSPLEGTGRYIVDARRGYFRLVLPEGEWESKGQAICSFNFWRVTGPEVPFSPPPGSEVFEVDIGFVCASLSGRNAVEPLNIIDGRIHTFLLRPASAANAPTPAPAST